MPASFASEMRLFIFIIWLTLLYESVGQSDFLIYRTETGFRSESDALKNLSEFLRLVKINHSITKFVLIVISPSFIDH